MKKFLVTGASGFLGWNLYQTKPDYISFYGLAGTRKIKLPGAKTASLDLTNLAQLKKLVSEINPDGIIHTAAIINANYCQEHREESFALNVKSSIELARIAADLNIPFVFTSTDLVFDGKKGDYSETDEVNPLSIYGEQKVEAEESILRTYPEAAVCRMPLMFGYSGPVAEGNLERFVAEIKANKAMKLFTDEYRSPLGGISASKGLWLALEKFQGIYHLGGQDKLSRFKIGDIITQSLGLKSNNLIATKQSELIMAAPRPSDVSLDSSKALANGFEPMNLKTELQSLAQHF